MICNDNQKLNPTPCLARVKVKGTLGGRQEQQQQRQQQQHHRLVAAGGCWWLLVAACGSLLWLLVTPGGCESRMFNHCLNHFDSLQSTTQCVNAVCCSFAFYLE